MNRHKSSDTEQSRKIANLIQVCDKFVENNDYVNAIKSYSEIITIDDKNFHAWSNLGCLYNSLDLYDIALTCFENAQKLDFKPGSQEAYTLMINLGIVLGNLGRYEESLVFFNHLIRYEKSIGFPDHIIRIEPSLKDIWLLRGSALNNLGHYEKALHSFEQTLLIDPNHVEALTGKGFTLSQLKLFEEALPYFNRSIELDDSWNEAWFQRGLLMFKLEFYSEALFSFEKSIERSDKTHPELVYRELTYSALALLAIRNWKKSIDVFEMVFKSMPTVEKFDERITNQIVVQLLDDFDNQNEWQQLIQSLLKIYGDYSISHQLSKALLESIPLLLTLTFDLEKVRDWKNVWQDCVKDCSEFKTSLCLLDTAVNYRETKGNPLIYIGLSKKEEDLFKSFLGVETSPTPLDESKLILDAAFIALNGYKLLGRGLACFFGEEPEYLPREENMPDNILALVDDYNPDQEFIIMTSNQRSVTVIEFDEIGIESTQSLSESEYEQELEKVIELLVQQGLDIDKVNNLRHIVLTYRGTNLNTENYSHETLSFFQDLCEKGVSGNLESFVNFLNFYISI